ncbi:MAG TPA: STAS domain-containing protein [Solirubrobacteraceae bacterium]|nr:STAS domain-containing protein [Solirubrobacteraceae bacterium]
MLTHDPSSESPHTLGFEMHEERDERGGVRLSLLGELDLAVADQLRTRLQEFAHEHTRVLVDLSGLQFIDSTGLQILITYLNEGADNGWEFRVEPNLTSQVRRVIELVGLDRMFWP